MMFVWKEMLRRIDFNMKKVSDDNGQYEFGEMNVNRRRFLKSWWQVVWCFFRKGIIR